MSHEDDRQAAIERVKARRDFKNQLVVYAAVNTMLILIWAVSGAGYFWPIWPILGWGVGLAIKGWTVHASKPISEDDIRAELHRNGSPGQE